jgi:DNA polymerase-3 subunit delta'
MPFSEIVGHEQAVTVLRRALAGDRLATGYLFVGPPHVGKTTLAIALAQEANCERLSSGGTGGTPVPPGTEACGECSTCRRIVEEHHPDVRLVRPRLSLSAMKKAERRKGEEQTQEDEEEDEVEALVADMEDAEILVAAVIDLLSSASLAPVEARRRVYVVCSPERMKPEVSSRLLKVLEEPPPDTTFVLTTSRPGRMLPTIISRCQQVTLHPLPPEEMAARLAAAYPQATEEQRAVVAGLSAGAWGRAKRLMEEPEVLAVRREVLEMAASLTRREPWEAMRLAEDLASATERWWRAEQPGEVGERMLKAGRDRVLRTQLRAPLEVLESWFRDLMVVAPGGAGVSPVQGGGTTGVSPVAPNTGETPVPPGRLVNPDYREELLYAARRYPPAAAVEACRVLSGFRRDLGQNVNLRLGLEALWVRLMGL